MPRTKKTSKRPSKKSEMLNLEMPSEIGGESVSQRGEYGRRSTRPRTAARSSSVTRTSIKTPGGARARKSTKTRTSRRAGAARKGVRGRAVKRGSRRSR